MGEESEETGEALEEVSAFRQIEGLSLTFTAELGRHSAPLKRWLSLGVGSQISLDRSWKDPLNLRLNGQLVGHGRVVLVGNQFGVVVDQWGKR